MINLGFAKNKTYIVGGLGKTGLSVAKALHAAGANVIVQDDDILKVNKAKALGYKIYNPDMVNWEKVEALILSPGIPHKLPVPHFLAQLAHLHHIPIICDIDLLAQAYPNAQYYGVTGTNGKSTTSALLYHQLKALNLNVYLGGNIGYPVLEFDLKNDDPIFVLELSSYQLERVPHLKAQTIIWLNLTSDHLDRHGNMDDYVKAKCNIIKPYGETQNIIIGFDDPHSRRLYNNLLTDNAKNLLKILELSNTLPQHPTLKGPHNHQNIMAVFQALQVNSLPFDQDTYLKFEGLPHRQELCGKIEGITYINDSKATNFESTKKLLMAYTQVHLILGGIAKDDGITGIKKFKRNISCCYLIGQASPQFAQQLDTYTIPYICCHTLEEAVKRASKNATVGEVIALSPACASLDQFRNFEHRGDCFKQLVKQLYLKN